MENEIKDEEIQIEVAEDVGQEQIVVAPAETSVVKPEDGIFELQKRLERERHQREAAEEQARRAHFAADQARREADSANIHQVQGALQILKQESGILRDNYRAASEAGDHYAASEAMEALQQANMKVSRLEEGLQAMQDQQRQVQRQPQQVQSDPVEALASQLTPRSAAWVRAHPEYATNPKLNAKMIAAHNLVTADDVVPDTDDYFSMVESILGVSSAPARTDAPMSAASAPTQRRSSPAAAPVSRSAGPGTNQTIVRLTSDQREMAQMMGMTDQEYAKNMLALKREGKMH